MGKWRERGNAILEGAVIRLRGAQSVRSITAAGGEVGKNVRMAKPVWIDPAFVWLVSIGDDAILGPDVKVIAHDASMKRLMGYTLIRPVRIGERSYIGACTIILPGVTIGADAVVGAGSVVRQDVPDGALVVGNPARVVGSAAEYRSRHLAQMDKGRVYDVYGITLAQRSPSELAEIREALANGPGYVR